NLNLDIVSVCMALKRFKRGREGHICVTLAVDPNNNAADLELAAIRRSRVLTHLRSSMQVVQHSLFSILKIRATIRCYCRTAPYRFRRSDPPNRKSCNARGLPLPDED